MIRGRGLSARALAIPALAVAFSLIWSSAFIAGKIAVARVDAATALSLRFTLSAVVLAPFASGGGFRAAGLGLGLGALNNAAYLGLTFWALTFTRPVVVVAVVSCAPFLTAGLAAALGVERVKFAQIVGAAIAFVGVVVITGIDGSAADLAGGLLAAAGTLAFSIATLTIRDRTRGAPISALNFWQSLAGAALLAPFARLYGQGGASIDVPTGLAIVYLALVVTIGGMAMWISLIRLTGAARASTYHLMNPFFGALLSAIVLGTKLRALDFVGAAVVALGLALSTLTAPLSAAGDSRR